MTHVVTSSLRWLRRHAIPAVAVTLIAGAAAGGGIAYAATSSHTSPPTSSSRSKGFSATSRPPVADRAPGAPIARMVLAILVKDTGLKLADIKADLQKGETLDQVAGANATTLENDIVNTIVKRLPANLPTPWHATAGTPESRIRARVHAILTMPGTDLLKLLDTRPGLAAGAFAPPAPHHEVRPPATAKPSAAA